MLKRRELIRRLSTVPLVGSFMASIPLVSAEASTPSKRQPPRDLFKEFGVRTFINAAGTLTYMTGSLMHDEVLEAINPSIEVGGGSENSLSVSVFMLKAGQEKIVASRLKEVLTQATA